MLRKTKDIGRHVDLAAMDLPMFTIARSSDPEQSPDVSELTQQMIDADAWIVVAPEYNGSFPPTLNNAIAWLSRDWQNFQKDVHRHPSRSCHSAVVAVLM